MKRQNLVSLVLIHAYFLFKQNSHLEIVKKTWRSPIYSFFKPSVRVEYENGRLCHFFPCAARQCKTKAGGVRRFLDKQVSLFFLS